MKLLPEEKIYIENTRKLFLGDYFLWDDYNGNKLRISIPTVIEGLLKEGFEIKMIDLKTRAERIEKRQKL